MPAVTIETFQAPDGSYRYRVLIDGLPRLTSGGFLLLGDAAGCGKHIASDPPSLMNFLDYR